MRYLTIQRNKSFVACLMKVKVYIEDPNSTEIKIQGVQCRKIGEIKNGEQQTFMIGDEKLRIYVIGDKLSKNYCCDFYEVPAGIENIFISGSCKYNPIRGNAFRFDGIPTEEMQYHRKKANKKGIAVFAVSIVIGIVIGLAAVLIPILSGPEEKVFTKSSVSITLNEDFKEEFHNGFAAVYGSNYMAVFMRNEKFNGDKEFATMTVDEYCQAVIETNGKDAETKHKDGLTYYEYTAASNNNYDYRYLCFTYKTESGFWLVQFAVEEDMYSIYEEDIFTYAKSVSFKEASSI